MNDRARSEITGRKMTTTVGVDPNVGDDATDAYGVEEFCRRHGISVQAFYKYRSEMPATFNVGSRVLISREAAARWRKERERLAAQAAS